MPIVFGCTLYIYIVKVQRATCIVGLFWHPVMRPKDQSYFSPMYLYCSIRTLAKVQMSGIKFVF